MLESPIRRSRRGRGTITIADVAHLAGVSTMTVSRVVNNRPVTQPTRDSVERAIKLLNYTPNAFARNLAAGEATHIGILYSNPSAAYLSQFLIGALSEASKSGCHLVLETCDLEDEAQQREAARTFKNARIQGVIIPSTLSHCSAVVDGLANAATPLVTVGTCETSEISSNVRIDDFAASKRMTEYLISLGHRRISLITGHPEHAASAQRERGFLSAAKAAGLDDREVSVAQGQFTFRSGLEAAERLLKQQFRPSAIFASNDDMAVAVVGIAQRMGLVVPRDLTVVGFDDTSPATSVWPELTTIRQPIAEMAATAVRLLMSDIRKQRTGINLTSEQIVMDHHLIVRGSSSEPQDLRRVQVE